MHFEKTSNYDTINITTPENIEDILMNAEDLPYLSPKRQLLEKVAREKGFEDLAHWNGFRYFNNLGEENTRWILDVMHN